MDNDPPLPIRPTPAASRPSGAERLSFPIAWAETGQFGTLYLPTAHWHGFDHTYIADGDPNHPSSRWVYSWNGRFFEPRRRYTPPAPPRAPSVWGSFGWTLLIGFFPAFIAFGIVANLTWQPGAGAPNNAAGLPFFIITYCVLWAIVHTRRMAKFDQ